MSLTPILFYLFAALLVVSSALVMIVRNPVHAVLFLVLAFFTSAAVWMLLEAEFLAITLVLVYVGAVMVLFLFVVMMLDVNITVLREGFMRYLPLGVIVAVAMMLEMGAVVGYKYFGTDIVSPPQPHMADYSNTKELGQVLYTVYMYPFEIAAVILLVAIIAAIALTLRRRPSAKYQNIGKQVATRRNDRLRIIKMPSERREEQPSSTQL